MNYYSIDLNGEEIKFRLTSADSMAIEKRFGVKLLDYIQDYSVTTVVNLLMYMRRGAGESNFNERQACELYDNLTNNGYTLEEIITKVIYETAVVSGFLKKEELDKMLEEKTELQNQLREKKKREILQEQ